MSSPPAEKRIRLNLERSSSRLPHDVTDKAEEIYIREGDPAEKLTRKITKIWETAAGKFDDFTEDLANRVVLQEQEEAEDKEGAQDDPAAKKRKLKARKEAEAEAVETRLVPRPGSAAEAVDIRKEIYGRLWHAQGEIRIALDVLNIIISSYQNPGGGGPGAGVGGLGGVAGGGGATAGPSGAMSSNAANTQQILPPGTLRCEYTSNTTVEASVQIQKEKMAIGGKRLQLKAARDILMQGAQKLQSVVSSEDHFWNSALRLRKNNWCIVSTNPGGAGGASHLHGHHRLASGSQLYVHYGFRDVGSTFPEQAYAEVVRVPSSGKDHQLNSIDVSIPNQTGKSVSFSLVPQGTPHTIRPTHQTDKRLVLANNPKSIHAKLHDAQTSVFDAELFQEFINEARNMTYSVTIVDNEVFMPINDDLELKISYRSDSTNPDASTSSASTEPSLSSSSSSDDPSKLASTLPSIPTDSNASLAFPPSASASSSSPSSHSTKPLVLDSSTAHLDRTAEILKCCMRLAQHKRHRQNIKEKRESFFKRSRPGALSGIGGSASGSSGGGGAAGGAGVGGGGGAAATGASGPGAGSNAAAVAAAAAADGGAASVSAGGGSGGGGGVGMGAGGVGANVNGATGGSGGGGGVGGAPGSGGGSSGVGGGGGNSGSGAGGPMMLDATLHLLQYYSFSRRIHEVVDRVTRPFRRAWWEPLEVHTWDMKKPPVAATAGGSSSSSSGAAARPGVASSSRPLSSPGLSSSSSVISTNGGGGSGERGPSQMATMGMAVSIRLGPHTPALRFVVRSHPAPCVVLQLANRPSVPIKHAAEFEQVLRQELALRAVGRLCDVANAISQWSAAGSTFENEVEGDGSGGAKEPAVVQPPKWIIDIERQCVGVFKTAVAGAKTMATKLVILQLDIGNGDYSHNGGLDSGRVGGELGLRMKFSVQKGGAAEPTKWTKRVSLQDCLVAPSLSRQSEEDAFKAWLVQLIAQELDL